MALPGSCWPENTRKTPDAVSRPATHRWVSRRSAGEKPRLRNKVHGGTETPPHITTLKRPTGHPARAPRDHGDRKGFRPLPGAGIGSMAECANGLSGT